MFLSWPIVLPIVLPIELPIVLSIVLPIALRIAYCQLLFHGVNCLFKQTNRMVISSLTLFSTGTSFAAIAGCSTRLIWKSYGKYATMKLVYYGT